MMDVNIYSDSLIPEQVKNVQRLDVILDGIEYTLLSLANGWIEVKAGASLLVHHRPNSVIIREDAEEGGNL